MDVDELRVRVAAWVTAFKRANKRHRFFATDTRADLVLRRAAGELIRLIRECGPGVRGVVHEGRLYLDSTDPVLESALGSESALWCVTRVKLTRQSFRLVEPG